MNENNANFTPDAPSFKKLTFMNMQKLTNFPYIEADFDALTNYGLLSKVVEYLNQVIANNNEQNEVVEGLYNAYVSLQDYVNNYFDNLDVQDEINNKLDEMAESGQLTDIIAQYLGLAGMIAFDTVADMKLAENLVNGSKCRTLGYYSINDGGGAYYKIRTVTNDDVVDEMKIIAVYDDVLVAELIYDSEITIDQLGTKDEDNFDCKPYFDKAFSLGIKKINLLSKRYRINGTLTVPINTTIYGINNYDNPSIISEIGNSNLLTINQRAIRIENVLLSNLTENSVHAISGTEFNNNHYMLILNNIRITNFNRGINLGGSIWWDCSLNNIRLSECNIGLYVNNCFSFYVNNLYTDRCATNAIKLYGSDTIKFDNCNIGVIADNGIDVAFGNADQKCNLEFNNCNFEYDTNFESAIRGGFVNVAHDYNTATCELLFTNCRFTINQQISGVKSMAFNAGTRATFINCFYLPNNTTDYPNDFFNASYPPKKEIGSLKFINGNSTLPRPSYGDSNKLCVHDIENEQLPSCPASSDASTFTNIKNGTMIFTTQAQRLWVYADNQWKYPTLN